MRALLAVLLCVFWMGLCIGGVAAHEAPSGWSYPMECCSERDCREMTEAETPKPLAGGDWMLTTGEIVPRGKVKFSPDGHFHICRWGANNAVLCFFAPPNGS